VPEPLVLPGIRSSTLLGYLKGLGVLSVLSCQDDPHTRGAWSREGFVLYADHDRDSLERFFLERWEPAPVVSPWNGGSGFFPKDNTEGLDAIEASGDPRLARFNDAIRIARSVLRDLGLTAKPEPKLEKPRLLRALRAALPDDAVEWLDAAVVMVEGELRFPPVLGSGGNDGRYDIANNYAQSVAYVVGLREWPGRVPCLRAALAGTPAPLRAMSLAHLTRDASPVNSPSGESDALGNPWDLVLAVTGSMVFAAGATRRLGAGRGAAAPFTMRPTGAGYGSAVSGEKGRDELWMPTWDRPASLVEVRALLREGRVQLGRRDAVTALDAARAAGALGVARGLTGFERFAILERAGQSNLTVPAGRVEVRPNPAVEALATLDPWLGRMVRRAGGDLPAGQRAAIRALEQAAFALASEGTAARAARLLAAVGAVEVACAVGQVEGISPVRAKAGPWLELLCDGADVETRLAIAFASLADPDAPAQALRAPLVGAHARYAVDDHATAREAPIVTQLASIHERRALAGVPTPPFGLPARLSDLERLVRGHLDERRMASLLRGLVVLDWRGVRAPKGQAGVQCVDPVLAHLVLAFHDPRREHELRLTPRADWPARLRANRVRDVVAEVHLRLRLGGLTPIAAASDLVVPAATASGERLAAALLARPAAGDVFRLLHSMTTFDDTEDDSAP